MTKLWIVLFFAAVSSVVAFSPFDGQDPDTDSSLNYDKSDLFDGDLQDWYDDLMNAEIPNEKQAEGSNEAGEDKSEFEDDYQIEDNRSEPREDSVDDKLDGIEKLLEGLENKDEKTSQEKADNTQDNLIDGVEVENSDLEPLEWDVSDAASLPLPPTGKVDETGKVVIEEIPETENSDEEKTMSQENVAEEEPAPLANSDLDVKRPAGESIEDNLEANDDTNNFDLAKVDITSTENLENDMEESELDEASKDLSEDLDKLLDTAKKLSDSDENAEQNADESINVLDYEEKYGRPFRESNVLAQRDDYYDAKSDEYDTDEGNENIEEYESDEFSDEGDQLNQAKDDYEKQINESKDKSINEQAIIETENDNSAVVKEELDGISNEHENLDSAKRAFDQTDQINDEDDTINQKDDPENVEKVVENDEAKNEQSIFEDLEELDENDDVSDEEDDLVAALSEFDTIINEIEKNTTTILAEAFGQPNAVTNSIDELVENKADAVATTHSVDLKEEDSVDDENNNIADNKEIKSKNTDVPDQVTLMINPDDYNNYMNKFELEHKDELDVNSDQFAKNVAPIHLTLSVEEPTVVTSPDWPSPYPTNNIVDWILEGDGMGVELNLTDFFVNGFNGDYLLIKPGGIDASGQDGLVFSYNLNTERRYRFLDVRRVFIRFHAGPGWPFRPGFRLSARMVSPPDDGLDELLPEPEAVLPPVPTHTLSLYLGGITLPEFRDLTEEFRVLIADMATLYINANNIDLGLNTTLEVTQITRVSVCNIDWPEFERCADVTIGVPLVYDEEEGSRLTEDDLRAMWVTYSGRNPFALRLNRMGITEFLVPNDGRVLTVWVVLAAGVVVAVCMFAFTMWRFSCFENYSRMPQFSDTDSVHSEKRGLDLYPTPHQTLPPLFESEYKWDDGKMDDSARVDIGGYANKSFTRDELYDIESDEEAISTRDRNGSSFTPRDIYEV